MIKKALFPGSFDPFTIGHEEIVRRALPLFDEIIIGIGINTSKKGLFELKERKVMIEELFTDTDKVKVDTFSGLTVSFCELINAQYILRGLRTAADFEYERTIAQLNQAMHPNLETILMLSQPQYSMISSTIVREILRFDGDIKPFVPENIYRHIMDRQNNKS
jgi:pantetheine-phosphate adenylyltransferase